VLPDGSPLGDPGPRRLEACLNAGHCKPQLLRMDGAASGAEGEFRLTLPPLGAIPVRRSRRAPEGICRSMSAPLEPGRADGAKAALDLLIGASILGDKKLMVPSSPVAVCGVGLQTCGSKRRRHWGEGPLTATLHRQRILGGRREHAPPCDKTCNRDESDIWTEYSVVPVAFQGRCSGDLVTLGLRCKHMSVVYQLKTSNSLEAFRV
jgi:hypothetical protein